MSVGVLVWKIANPDVLKRAVFRNYDAAGQRSITK
jgi:hypothetical protein